MKYIKLNTNESPFKPSENSIKKAAEAADQLRFGYASHTHAKDVSVSFPAAWRADQPAAAAHPKAAAHSG